MSTTMLIIFVLIVIIFVLVGFLYNLVNGFYRVQELLYDLNWHKPAEMEKTASASRHTVVISLLVLFQHNQVVIEKEDGSELNFPELTNGEYNRRETKEFVSLIEYHYDFVKVKMKYNNRKRKKKFDFNSLLNFDWLTPQPKPVPVRC